MIKTKENKKLWGAKHQEKFKKYVYKPIMIISLITHSLLLRLKYLGALIEIFH